jgi:chemosensory pili system protein ChpB (putative protein-glutamate methylesterase)
MKTDAPAVRVALVSRSEQQRANLKAILEKNGLQVVLSHAPDDILLSLTGQDAPDVLLLDIDDEITEDQGFLERLLEQCNLPVLFNDSTSSRVNAAALSSDWGRTLAQKLRALAVQLPAPEHCPQSLLPPLSDIAYRANVAEAIPLPGLQRPVEKSSTAAATTPRAPLLPLATQRVWVLGASIGGPQAVKKFLSDIPAHLPVTFLLVQHIGREFIALFAEQISNVTPFQVLIAQTGHALRHQQVVIAPVEQDITINVRGEIELRPVSGNSLYRPSIDGVMSEVAKHYRSHAGAIIFSGMGDDGVKGAHAIIEQGGIVWAQDAASSMINGMPGLAREAGAVSFSATPELLAQQLIEHLTPSLRAGVVNAQS